MLRPDEAAKILNVSIEELYKRVPHLALGPRTHRFDASDIEAALYGESVHLWAQRFASDAKHARPGTVYFIEAVGSDRVKIGWTAATPQKRMAEIQTSSPFELRLVASAKGSLAIEAGLHARFEESRVMRCAEWFHATPELHGLIAHVRSTGDWP